jgi:tetratricopeptide (TPR) repeat protein
MKNTFIGLLIFSMSFCGSINAQHSEDLRIADSLIYAKNYIAAEGLIQHVIDKKISRFELSRAYFLLSKLNLEMGILEKAVYHNNQSLSIRKNLDYEFIADNYFLFGLIEMRKGDNEKALSNFFKTTELPYESVEFSGLLYAYIAQVYYRKGDIENVLKYYRIAMGTLKTAFEEANTLDLSHYKVRRNRLYYDNFLIGYL